MIATTKNQISGYTYDAAGNMTTNPGVGTYTYDAENRMTVTAGVTYTYDGDGKRLKKSNGKLYWYGMSSDALLETDAAGGTPMEFIFFGGKRIARRHSTGAVSYFFADHLGTSRVVTNAAGGNPEESDFYPFGGERVVTETLPDQNYKFTGKERDTESGLDFFIARHYASNVGRFLQPDEFTGGPVDAFSSSDPLPPGPLPYGDITNPQSLNKYTYTLNNPLRYTDPDGHGELDFWMGVANAVTSNFFLGQGRTEPYNRDNAAGQAVGDVISAVGGLVEMAAGSTAAGGGAVACGSGAGCLVGAPAVAAGVIVGAHGAVMAGTAVGNLLSDPIQMSNPHGSRGAPDHQQTAAGEAKKLAPTGRREVTIQTPGGERALAGLMLQGSIQTQRGLQIRSKYIDPRKRVKSLPGNNALRATFKKQQAKSRKWFPSGL